MPYTGNIVMAKVAWMPNCTLAASSSYNNSFNDKACTLSIKLQ